MVKRGAKSPEKPPSGGVDDAVRTFDAGFRARLAEVINDFPTRKQAADVAGKVTDQLGRYIRDAADPPFETVAALAEARGFSLDWVWSGRGQKKAGGDIEAADPEMLVIPVHDVRAGAGGGEQWVDDEAPISSLALPRSFILANGIKPNSAKLIFCTGRSMEPTIQDAAPMIVDTSDMGERDDVYVMRRGNGIIVKRIQHLSDGAILLKSDNPAYEPERLPRDEADELMVIGRVGLVLQSI